MKEVSKFPFIERSTMRLTALGYSMPLDVFLDANFYPRCENKPPFYISSIKKTRSKEGKLEVVLQVSDSSGIQIFSIHIDITNYDKNKLPTTGVGIQNGVYCGGCLLSSTAVPLFTALPSIPAIPTDSLIFSASAVRPIPGSSPKNSEIMFKGERVTSITWGKHITEGSVDVETIGELDVKDSTMNTIVVNGVSLTGPNVFITPCKNGVIRVLNSSDITIGRLSDL